MCLHSCGGCSQGLCCVCVWLSLVKGQVSWTAVPVGVTVPMLPVCGAMPSGAVYRCTWACVTTRGCISVSTCRSMSLCGDCVPVYAWGHRYASVQVCICDCPGRRLSSCRHLSLHLYPLLRMEVPASPATPSLTPSAFSQPGSSPSPSPCPPSQPCSPQPTCG